MLAISFLVKNRIISVVTFRTIFGHIPTLNNFLSETCLLLGHWTDSDIYFSETRTTSFDPNGGVTDILGARVTKSQS